MEKVVMSLTLPPTATPVLYVLDVRHTPRPERVTAWHPVVAGITEVFHARFLGHAYPAHTHDTWTLLIVDDGAINYALDRHGHDAAEQAVTLLPPHVVHDGRAATRYGFRKRVLYLDESVLDPGLVDASVDTPTLHDPLLRRRIDQLHRALATPADAFEAESRLAFVGERLRRHLVRHPSSPPAAPDRRLATGLRDLIDARTAEGVSLRQAAEILHADPSHLVRSFTGAYGVPPHRYLTGRRIDSARRRLLAGEPPAEVAVAVGFHDQSHLSRHFRRYLGATPARYSASAPTG
ncbi:AraC family transcriptional regulator [Micromonospora sp. NBC_01796]|uniref:AraC family transcriptional regulator n=1 Tax=Micromonospora sp. NBC_01796 TaxID=2975987 RepID=UPI002DDC7995|nr:AraC family transcriptional regulator [Micromonospora sp. NBC_01796]WSA83070.1 AraC family transcriptional regulator [Micromonospora sp. NBC_01796]